MTELGPPLAILGAGLGVAVAFDVAQRRIPNPLVALIAVTGLAVREWSGGATGLVDAVLAGAITLLALLVPWASGLLGGGDLKLAAAAAVWLTPSRLGAYLVFTAVAGGPVALATLAAHRWRVRHALRAVTGAGGLALDAAPKATVPMAVAIALGALAALRWRLS